MEGVTDPVLLEKYAPILAQLAQYRGRMPQTDQEVKAAFGAELKNILNPNGLSTNYGVSYNRALNYAMREYYKYTSAPDPNSDPAAVQMNAVNKIMDDIRKGQSGDITSMFTVSGVLDLQIGTTAVFSKFEPGHDLYDLPDMGLKRQEVVESIRKNNNYVLEQPFVSTTLAERVAEQVNNGQFILIPPFINDLSEITGIPSHEILTKQLELRGFEGLTVEPDLVQKLRTTITDPELLRIIKTPTAANINSVAQLSGNQVPFVRKGVDGYFDVMSLARTIQFRAPNVMAAIWALETGYGSTVHGSNALFNVKSYDGTGTSTTTIEQDANGRQYTVRATFRNFNSPAEAAQDFVDTISKYPGVSEANTPREMLSAIVAGGYATDIEYEAKVQRVLQDNGVDLDEPFIMYNGPITRDPNYSSQTLQHVYNVGSIGWGSTGPHLDLKQEDNPNTPDVDETGSYFKYDDPEISEYIFVDDQTMGLVPLPDVPMTNSWKDHTDRGSNGYDYGIHDGRPILIKPPARVVQILRTSEGDDMMVIELPSGRRFKFHHGRKA